MSIMDAIANLSVIEAAVGRWKPSDIAFIRELRFQGVHVLDDGTLTSSLMLRALLQPRPPISAGWPDPRDKFWEVKIEFVGIRELKISQDGAGDLQVQGFDIKDHTGAQMEDVNLEVLDHDDGCISFWAKNAVIQSCREATGQPTTCPFGRVYPLEFQG